MNRTILSMILTVLVLLVSGVGTSQRTPDVQAEEVVWQYLQNELERGRNEKDYWAKRWRTPLPSSMASLSLGSPYARYRLPDDQIERFVESQDLLQSATMVSVSFPVFDGGNLIGAVQVQDRAGEWAWYSTANPAGSSDSLAIAFQQKGSTISLVGADHLGAFLVFTPLGGSEPRIYPMQIDIRSFLQSALDANGTMAYSGAMAALRPVAMERLNYRKQMKEVEP